jgi:hypothetical protein
MAALRAEEHVLPGATVLAASASLPGALLYLGGQQFGEEGGEVNRHEWLPVRAAV